jgi:two-component system, chemotaxis family, CheB/CheR fusion protein
MSGEENGAEQSFDRPIIVAIGASAGGVRALQAFFDEVPAQTGAAYVVVVHLDPQHRSELPSILAARTRMPVIQVEAREQLKANQVYVIPPDRRLQVIDHEISAIQFDEPPGQRSAIDLFFRSVAERLGDGLAVILSGAGSDGTVGVKAVKEAGGIILVQDPSEAEYSSMPRSAIATGVADFVLPVHELVARLVELIRLKQSGAPVQEPPVDEEWLRRILAHLRIRTGHDFSKYKRATVVRRLARRMQVARAETLKEYYEALNETAEEAHALLADLLISVTTFFRDADAFNALKVQVLSKLLEKDPTDTVRVWVPGCATGEEAYTLGMLLLEEASRYDLRPAIQVFGSDIDASALRTAREGWYSAAIETDVSEDRLRRFFLRERDGYRVRPELRDIVLFAVHDLLKDPPFSHIDLISCRNLLIYLDQDLQEQVCSTFHYALKPGSFLLLGASETADNPRAVFRTVDRNARIYQSTPYAGERPRLLPRLLRPVAVREQTVSFGRAPSPNSALNEAARHRAAIEKLAPPSILVDEMHRAAHLSETVGRFIAPSGGLLSGDVVDLVRPELRFELRSALHRAFEQNEASFSVPIPVQFNGAPHRVHLLVRPAPREGVAEAPQAVVMFIEGGAADPLHEGFVNQQATDETVRRRTEELQLNQSRLRTTQEESEAANEELRAANEELQSINEEYRSTSEELETSKEELQSINEELQTVNSELKLKLDAISRAHSDLQNLMAATDFGTLFLDSELRIKRFTQQITELFSITASDEGRPVTDFAHPLEYEDLIRDVRKVLSDLTPVRRETHSRGGRWYDVRMRPYRTVDDKIDGVVITFIDVTERRQVEEALRESERQLRQQKRLVELSRAPIFVWDFDGAIIDWNRGSEELYGYSRAEAVGERKEELLGLDGQAFEEMKAELLKEGSWSGERRQKTKDGRLLTVETRLQLESFDSGRLVLESTRDVTDRTAWEERQNMLLHELSHRVKNTLAVVQAIAHQTLRTSGSPNDFVERFEGRLTALASAHDLLMESDWQGADLAALARDHIGPYTSDRPDRLQLKGEPIALPADLATPFALVLHELATNAAKYGALADPNGTVGLEWRVIAESERVFEFIWQERGGPPVIAPTKSGLGSALIEGAVPNATVKREYGEYGLKCTIKIPLWDASYESETAKQ